MVFFLLFGPAFFIWFYLETHFPAWDRRKGLHTFFYGALLTLPFFFIHGFPQGLFSISDEGWKLFAKGFFLDQFLPLLYLLVGYVWWHRKEIMISVSEQVARFLAFGAGGLIPIALRAHLSFRGWEEGLQYLLIPFVWIQLLYVGSLSVGIWFFTVRWERFLVIGAGLGWMLLLGWFSYLYRGNLRFVSWILICVSFMVATIIFPKLIDRAKYL